MKMRIRGRESETPQAHLGTFKIPITTIINKLWLEDGLRMRGTSTTPTLAATKAENLIEKKKVVKKSMYFLLKMKLFP